ncbi:MAG: hypothetical protein F4139_09800, partial [Gemmatimonadetes bacterium]|nr:hypothetical protein [Gemmatimonadota bacterium]
MGPLRGRRHRFRGGERGRSGRGFGPDCQRAYGLFRVGVVQLPGLAAVARGRHGGRRERSVRRPQRRVRPVRPELVRVTGPAGHSVNAPLPGAPGGDALTAVDRRFLARAIELGRKGWGQVHPNPMVGTVVARGGVVLAEAHHARFGGPHAEAAALAELGGRARGATLYSSLEPCAHVGKTPPCTAAIHGAGIERVVFWAAEPGRAE